MKDALSSLIAFEESSLFNPSEPLVVAHAEDIQRAVDLLKRKGFQIYEFKPTFEGKIAAVEFTFASRFPERELWMTFSFGDDHTEFHLSLPNCPAGVQKRVTRLDAQVHLTRGDTDFDAFINKISGEMFYGFLYGQTLNKTQRYTLSRIVKTEPDYPKLKEAFETMVRIIGGAAPEIEDMHVMSGYDESCRPLTENWTIPEENRKKAIVWAKEVFPKEFKQEFLFRKNVKEAAWYEFVFDWASVTNTQARATLYFTPEEIDLVASMNSGLDYSEAPDSWEDYLRLISRPGTAMEEGIPAGVLAKLKTAYEGFLSRLKPPPEIEDMHTFSGYDESRYPTTDFSEITGVEWRRIGHRAAAFDPRIVFNENSGRLTFYRDEGDSGGLNLCLTPLPVNAPQIHEFRVEFEVDEPGGLLQDQTIILPDRFPVTYEGVTGDERFAAGEGLWAEIVRLLMQAKTPEVADMHTFSGYDERVGGVIDRDESLLLQEEDGSTGALTPDLRDFEETFEWAKTSLASETIRVAGHIGGANSTSQIVVKIPSTLFPGAWISIAWMAFKNYCRFELTIPRSKSSASARAFGGRIGPPQFINAVVSLIVRPEASTFDAAFLELQRGLIRPVMINALKKFRAKETNFGKLSQLYNEIHRRLFAVPLEIEDMHVMSGYDESQEGDWRPLNMKAFDTLKRGASVTVKDSNDSRIRPAVFLKRVRKKTNIGYKVYAQVKYLTPFQRYGGDVVTDEVASWNVGPGEVPEIEDMHTISGYDEAAQEYTSALTSINSTQVPSVFARVNWVKGSKNIDIGGGRFDIATRFLAGKGVKNFIYDPYNRPEKHNARVRRPDYYDTATISNVLNVIKEPSIRLEVLRVAYESLKEGGQVFITVYEGNGSGQPVASTKGWQENRRTVTYLDEVRAVFPTATMRNRVITGTKAGSPAPEKKAPAKATSEAVEGSEDLWNATLPEIEGAAGRWKSGRGREASFNPSEQYPVGWSYVIFEERIPRGKGEQQTLELHFYWREREVLLGTYVKGKWEAVTLTLRRLPAQFPPGLPAEIEPFSARFQKMYRDVLALFKPVEIEDMHTISGYDEALIARFEEGVKSKPRPVKLKDFKHLKVGDELQYYNWSGQPPGYIVGKISRIQKFHGEPRIMMDFGRHGTLELDPISLSYPAPPEIEDMHTISGYDEGLVESSFLTRETDDLFDEYIIPLWKEYVLSSGFTKRPPTNLPQWKSEKTDLKRDLAFTANYPVPGYWKIPFLHGRTLQLLFSISNKSNREEEAVPWKKGDQSFSFGGRAQLLANPPVLRLSAVQHKNVLFDPAMISAFAPAIKSTTAHELNHFAQMDPNRNTDPTDINYGARTSGWANRHFSDPRSIYHTVDTMANLGSPESPKYLVAYFKDPSEVEAVVRQMVTDAQKRRVSLQNRLDLKMKTIEYGLGKGKPLSKPLRAQVKEIRALYIAEIERRYPKLKGTIR
jgi:hypothetical protein